MMRPDRLRFALSASVAGLIVAMSLVAAPVRAQQRPVSPDPAASITTTASATPTAATALAAPADTSPPSFRSTADLWDRIRRGFQIPDLTGPMVDRKQDFYLARPDHVLRVSERSRRYLYLIVEEVEQRGMPTELALLPFIESAFNPQAVSSAKALGMWQFMPATGRDFGLRQNLFQDDRRNVIESTRAALDYLDRLHTLFGDWHLALAAYNWGEGAVSRAIEANRRKGLPTDYESLRMPEETRAYVPTLQAVKNIVADPAQFNLVLPRIDDAEDYVAITRTADIDVSLAARFAGLSVDEFKALNPSFHQPIIVAANQPTIVLPKDRVEQFLDNLSFFEGPLASFSAYVLRAGETLDKVSARFGTSVAALRNLNSIPANGRPKAGSTLLVPRASEATNDIPEEIAEHASLSLEQRRAGRVAGAKSATAARPAARGATRRASSATAPARAKAASARTAASRPKAAQRHS